MSNPRRRLVQGLLTALAAACAFLLTMTDYAEASSSKGTVRTGRTPLRIRTAATTSAPVIGSLRNRSKVTLVCYVSGKKIKGPSRKTSARWHLLATGGYVSDAYITGANPPRCQSGPAPARAPAAPSVTYPSGSMTSAQFIAASVAPAQRAQRQYRIPASIVIAQAIIESNWGRSSLAREYNNFFGIKCNNNGTRGQIAVRCQSRVTTEYVGTTYQSINAAFRVYATTADSFLDHSVVLSGSRRYANAFRIAGNADQFAYEIWKSGYASDQAYPMLLKSIMTKYNLYQYNHL